MTMYSEIWYFLSQNFENEKDLKEDVHRICESYLGVKPNCHDEIIPKVLLSNHRLIDLLKKRIDDGEIDGRIFDPVLNDVKFQLQVQYMDFCDNFDDVKTVLLVKSELRQIVKDEELFKQFQSYLLIPEHLMFFKEVCRFKSLCRKKKRNEEKMMEKAKEIYNKFFIEQLVFIDIGYEKEIGLKIEKAEICLEMFDPIYDEICKLLSHKLSQWKEEKEQTEAMEDYVDEEMSSKTKKKNNCCW